MDSMDKLIKDLLLEPHPEGGYFRETYRSSQSVMNRSNKQRCASTAIYYLLGPEDCSSWHRIQSDEIWHFYKGVPLNIYHFEGPKLVCQTLGPQQFQVMVPANHYFAAKPAQDGFCLVGCTVAPGFDFVDFELADLQTMQKIYPEHLDFIREFYPG